ncbi:interleukin-20 receptor subunit alpha [Brachyistius frenatus]|uniref:interleukin-20 receptor subunit alpha n=1 Tax=Brachyistius frenatus TaxID=100188 RepID=UPI0037E8A0B0
MWAAFISVNLWGLLCTVSTSPPSPINVTFSSVNLRNVLQWFPGHGTLDDTHFTVEYAIYGDSIKDSKGRRVHWRAVWQCTEIVRTWCDISNETWDVEQGYHARVRAVGRRTSSKWALTRRRFDPKLDTSLGPPLLSVEIEDNTAIVTLKGPMRYQPSNHIPALSMATIYPQMTYNLSIHNTHRKQIDHFPVVTSPYKYRLMDYSTQYCFSAQSRFLSMPVHCQSSGWHCVSTPQDPVIEQLQRVVVGIVVPSLCLCIIAVAVYLLYNYLTGKGQTSPHTLNPPPFHSPPLIFHHEKFNIITISVIKDEPPSDHSGGMSKPASTSYALQVPPPTYFPQRPETPPEPEEPWDDLSMDYGCISTAPIINAGEEEARGSSRDEGDNGIHLKGEHQKYIVRVSHKKTEEGAEDGHSAGVCASQVKSYLSQRLTGTCIPTHMGTHPETEMSTPMQAHTLSQLHSVLLNRTQAPSQSFQGSTAGEVKGQNEDRELPGLFIGKHPENGLFHLPQNIQTKKEVARGGDIDEKMKVGNDKKDGGVEEEGEHENVPLLSKYTSHNITNMSASHSNQLSDNYGVVRPAAVQETDEDEYDDEDEEEKRTICVNWDPETRELVLPELEMGLNRKGGLDRLILLGRGMEDRIGEEDEEVYGMKGQLRLENVIVRQVSEEEAEAQREIERGGEIGWKEGDILSKWNLVISVDQ